MRHLWKKLIGWMLCLTMAAGMLPGMTRKAKAAEEIVVDGIRYAIDEGEAWVIKCASESGSVTIPSTVSIGGTDYAVIGINDSAFSGCSSIETVNIPDSVTGIEANAFYGCVNLTSVVLSSNLEKIGNNAFNSCSNLTSILLPNKLTSIGTKAFYGCDKLKTVWVSKANEDMVTKEVFPGVTNVITYNVDRTLFPANLTYNGGDQADTFIDACARTDSLSKACIEVKQGETILEEGEAYQVMFSKTDDDSAGWSTECIDAGTYQVMLSGCNTAAGYVGEVTDASWTFEIKPFDLSTVPDDIRNVEFIYDGKDQKGRIKDAFKTQLEGIGITFHDGDYTVKFSADSGANWSTDVEVIDAGSGYQVKILGVRKNCTGEREESFKIKPASLVSEGISFDFGNGDFIYDGDDLTSAITSALRVKFGEKVLTVATDYSLEYFDSSSQPVSSVKNIGEYTVKITGKGDFTDSVTKSFEIKPSSGLTVSLENSSFEYDGTAKAIGNNPTTNAKGGTTTFTYSFEENGTYVENLASLTKTEAGDYTIYVKATNPNYESATTTAKLSITKRGVTFTADSASKEYDGTALTKDSYTVTELASGDSVASVTITGSQTVTGSGENVPSGAKIVNAAGDDVTGCYEVMYENGELVVSPVRDEIVVTIVGATDTITCDEQSHSVEGFTYSAKRGDKEVAASEYTVTFAEGKKAVASGTAAGTYSMGLTEGDFTVTSANYANIKIVYTDGKLTIEQAKQTTEDDTTVDNATKDDATKDDSSNGTQQKAEYNAVSGAGVTSNRGSDTAMVFRFKRAADDETTIEHLRGILVDGAAVPAKDASGRMNWTARKGSVIIELQPAYLDTLSVGEHMITVVFDDGESSAMFKILEAIITPAPTADVTPAVTPSTDPTATVTPAADATPVTGDNGVPALWAVLILLSVIGMAAMAEKKRRQA